MYVFACAGAYTYAAGRIKCSPRMGSRHARPDMSQLKMITKGTVVFLSLENITSGSYITFYLLRGGEFPHRIIFFARLYLLC